MKEVVSKFKKLFSSFENLDNRYQFAIVGAFLILVYVFKNMKVRKIQSESHKKLREMAANIHDQNKQKRDGIIWFFQLFVGLSFLSLFLLISGYGVFLLKVKPVIQFLDVIKVDEDKCASILKISLLIFILICLILYRLIYHYNAKITRKAPLNDQELQEQMDKIKSAQKEAKTSAKQQEHSKQSQQSEVESPSKHGHIKTD